MITNMRINETTVIKEPYDVTPVERHNGIYYKRDDLYRPFGVHDANGGKTRQAYLLLDKIKNEYDGVITHSGVHSPQGYIIARMAKHFNMKCIVTCGGTKPETIKRHHMCRAFMNIGAESRNVCGHGMKAPIETRSIKLANELGYYWISFAINSSDYPDAIFNSIEYQVQNIPDELDNLIIPVGSGIQMAGILMGLEKYNKKVKRVIGVHVGPDRRKSIDKYLEQNNYFNLKYELHKSDTAYSTPRKEYLGYDIDNEQLDEIYESKAHKWMGEKFDFFNKRSSQVIGSNPRNEKTLFWVIGRRLFEDELKEHYGI